MTAIALLGATVAEAAPPRMKRDESLRPAYQQNPRGRSRGAVQQTAHISYEDPAPEPARTMEAEPMDAQMSTMSDYSGQGGGCAECEQGLDDGGGGWDSCGGCGTCDSCCDPCLVGRCPTSIKFTSGFQITLLKPYFSDNIAYSTTDSDAQTFTSTTDAPFRYGLSIAPRIWIGASNCDNLGIRARYWQFDQEADPVAANPPANGLGQVAPAPFSNVNQAIANPNQTLFANSSLEMHVLDLEGTKWIDFCNWSFGAAAGLRYGANKQYYQSRTTTAEGATIGTIDFSHNFDGVGPTFALEGHRQLTPRLGIFSNARASLLFGETRSALDTVSNQNANNPVIGRRYSNRFDSLPIGEIQVGADWCYPIGTRATLNAQIAMEGQVWEGMGSASSEIGDVGLFGFSLGGGVSF
jgi:hypothetical protein